MAHISVENTQNDCQWIVLEKVLTEISRFPLARSDFTTQSVDPNDAVRSAASHQDAKKKQHKNRTRALERPRKPVIAVALVPVL